MFRVMIIDDEKMSRNLLKITIKWEQLGFELCGEAASGIEAINTIDDIRPDIAFVDIRMPFMDGIEFSRIAINRYPKLKIIILTAFDDFEYARECIGIGICDYLLKPVNREAIGDSLLKVREKLEQEQPEKTEVYLRVDGDSIIAKIKEYIGNHYKEPELNLTSVAMEFGFNSSYLSRMFKAETGSAFIDYLTSCRMECAILLARDGMFMYQVAKEVGIPDPNYFGKCFKKYTQFTFSDFVKQ